MSQPQDELWPRNQVAWRCRRGMLELDVLLIDFFERCYDNLDHVSKLEFQQLLSLHDVILQQDLLLTPMSHWCEPRDGYSQLVRDIRLKKTCL